MTWIALVTGWVLTSVGVILAALRVCTVMLTHKPPRAEWLADLAILAAGPVLIHEVGKTRQRAGYGASGK